MAVSVNWATKVITIPRADMPVIQAAPPIEVRELDLNWFRLQLKDLEDSAEAMCSLDTHRHNTEVMVGGITYARVLEIINGYMVTFEDGQYAVQMTGANSNVMDVLNPNQVSVRSNNAAGLVVGGGSADLTPVLAAIADLDGDLGDVHSDVGALGMAVDDVHGDVAAVAGAVTGIPAATLDGQEIVPGMSVRTALRVLLAAEAGLVRGATGGTADEWIELLEALSSDRVRVRALVDQYGNRKQIQVDLGE